MGTWAYRDELRRVLKQLKRQRKLSTEDLSSVLGRSTAAVYSWTKESGPVPPDEILDKIASLAGINKFLLRDNPLAKEMLGNAEEWKLAAMTRLMRVMDDPMANPDEIHLTLSEIEGKLNYKKGVWSGRDMR